MGADVVPSPALPPLDQVREYIRASKAENTLRGYQSDWRAFCAWTDARRLCAMPASPETVAAFIADCAGRLKVGSVQRRLNAIAEAHKAVGLDSPTHNAMVTNTMKGIRRTKGTAPAQKAATLIDDIRAMVDATDAGLIGLRDRALVLLGFAGAFRRSELVGLDVTDCDVRQGRADGDIAEVEDGSDGGRAERSAYLMAAIPRRARSAQCRRGWNWRRSVPGRCSARSIDMGRFRLAACRAETWRGW